MKTLYGPDGQPITRKNLQHEIAAPRVSGALSHEWDSVADRLTIDRLATVMRNSINDDNIDFLTLAEEMEERDP
ncbi:MAG: DUF935 family protein, partial [Pseudomonadota bacterium]